MTSEQPGSLAILNVGAGDTKLTFDNTDPAEVARASRIVKDMIRRGFVILIEIGNNEKGPIYQRAKDFDEATAEYIVAGSPGDQQEGPTDDQEPSKPARAGRKAKAPVTLKPALRTERIPARSAKAIAIAKTAGG